MLIPQDEYWMQRALELAKQAAEANEVPVGAVLVTKDIMIAEGYNSSILTCDPTAHAEIMTLRKAAININNYRLINTTLYVTLEPCFMCAGAMIQARIKRLVFGATDPKAGVIHSQAKLLEESFLNHRITYTQGILEKQCGQILSQFFQAKRAAQKNGYNSIEVSNNIK